MKNIFVASIMTREPVTVKPETNLLECAKKMVRKRIGSLLLVEKKHLVGFISQQDILWALIKKSKEDLSNIKAADISQKKIATVKPTTTIPQVIEKMKKLRFERLPVIHNGMLVGIITVKDILNFHPEVYPELDEFAKIREESEKLRRMEEMKKRRSGVCEECGNFDILYMTNGVLLCENCRGNI